MDDVEESPHRSNPSSNTPSSTIHASFPSKSPNSNNEKPPPLRSARTDINDGSYEYTHKRAHSHELIRMLQTEGQKQQQLRKPLHALTSTGTFDPITVMALIGGVVGSIFTITIGLGGFNHVPNFGYATWHFGQQYPGSVSSCLTIIGNVIAGCLTLPIAQAITVYLRWKVGRGVRLKISSLKLYNAVLSKALFSQDGLKSWLGSEPTLKAWSLPLAIALAFANALVVPLLSQDWSPYVPIEFLWAYQTTPVFNETTLSAVLGTYSGRNLSTITDELSPLKMNVSVPSYVKAATYAANPEVALYLSGLVQRFSIYSGPGKTAWSGGAPPAVPWPDAIVLEVENLLTDRLYSNCPDCTDIITRIESAGLDPQYDCSMITTNNSGNITIQNNSSSKADTYGIPLASANIKDWAVTCSFNVTGARWNVYRSRNNATGWYYRIPNSSFKLNNTSASVLRSISDDVVKETIRSSLPDILRYEDLSTVRGRATAAKSISRLLRSAYTTTFFVLFSSYTLINPNDKSHYPQMPLDVQVYSGLFGQGSLAPLQAALLAIILMLSLMSGAWLFYMASTGGYVSVCNMLDPVSTLVLDCGSDGRRFRVSTGDATAIPERIEGVQLVVDESGENRMVCITSGRGERGVSIRRRPQPELLYE